MNSNVGINFFARSRTIRWMAIGDNNKGEPEIVKIVQMTCVVPEIFQRLGRYDSPLYGDLPTYSVVVKPGK
ncbi:Hypothetical protein NTJ_06959 [Nesidiocoris tenuis]|uniref:Uncharacterized protein n=1 Tax=Nesidiocoris tenuis TaxID=355587 RepID=A0ABN7AQ97_9HEMI|nr:Hypothetical protein NTJ_06959 [Nesidiocoris tenuis]